MNNEPQYAPLVAAARVGKVGIFLVALAATHFVLNAVLPLPFVGEVSEKLAYFARHKDDYDAVFVGSSRVCRQIAPGVFDQEVTAATRRPMRSFNLGAPSMFLPESLFVIHRILDQKPVRLRWMFIELNEPRPRLEEHVGLVRREVYWHGWRETMLASVNILRARSIHKLDRLAMLAHQWLLFGRCWTHMGTASEWLERECSLTDPSAASADEAATLGPSLDGYTPYRSTLGTGKGGAEDVYAFTTAVAALRVGKARSPSPPAAPILDRKSVV